MKRSMKLDGAIRAAAAALAFVGMLGITGTGEAATVTVHSVIDLTQWNLSGGIGALGTAPDSALFQQGDTVILDIDFLGSQTLKFDSVSGIGGAVLTSVADCPNATSSLVLHDYTGSGSGAISGGLYQGCAAQQGANFPQGSPGFPSGPIEFSGVTFTFANVVVNGGPRYASGGRLDIGGMNGSIGQLAAAVPEPSSWALMIAGFGSVGCALRRRKLAIA